jgi:hypothetical protein
VYNLRVRDLQKELRQEKVDYKPKWNKKQLQDFYLQILVEKHQHQSTQSTIVVKDANPLVIESKNEIDVINCEEDTKYHCLNRVNLNCQQPHLDNLAEGKTTNSRSSIIMADVEHCFASTSIAATKLQIDQQIGISTDIENREITDQKDHRQSASRMSIEYTDQATKDVELPVSLNNTYVNQVVLPQIISYEPSRALPRSDPKVKVTEVKKGMVANVKAAYMEAVEAKKSDFVNQYSPGPASTRKSAKQTRSPLKTLVQSSVQSAVRMLSPASRHRLSSAQCKLPTVSSMLKEHEQIRRIEDDYSRNNPAEEVERFGTIDSMLESKGSGECLSTSLQNMNESTTVLNGNNTSSFKSQAAKASSAARKAKIEEMRTKVSDCRRLRKVHFIMNEYLQFTFCSRQLQQ